MSSPNQVAVMVDGAPVMHAPAPFSAATIRDATQPGRTYVFDSNGNTLTMTFVAVDADGARLRSVTEVPAGHAPIPERISGPTWAELESHAHFPAAVTTIGEGRVTVPAGSYDTRRYTVVQHGTVMVYDFAMDLPGPPVRLQLGQENGPPPKTIMALLEFSPGD